MSSPFGSDLEGFRRSRQTLPPMHRRPSRGVTKKIPPIHAFSLVEVTIALAVLSFAIISLLGLITVAIKSTHNSDVQGAQSAIVSTITGKLSSQNFTNTVISLPFINYFTLQGVETNASAAIYRCEVTDVSPPGSATNFMRQVQLTIRWPPPLYSQTNIIAASFVKYD